MFFCDGTHSKGTLDIAHLTFTQKSKCGGVAEPPNLMPLRSARLPLDTKHPKENTKLLGSVGHTPKEEPKNFPSGSQMRE